MFKSQLEPPSDNFMETQIFVENIFDTVKKAREAKAAARSLAESKISPFELSPSKRKKARKSAKGKRATSAAAVTPSKKKPRKPRTPKEAKRTPRKYTKRAKVKPPNDIDDEEAAFILSSISQRSFDSFYNRLNGSSSSSSSIGSVVIPLELPTTPLPPNPLPTQQQPWVVAPCPQQFDHATAYHHVLLDHNYWVPPPAPPQPPQPPPQQQQQQQQQQPPPEVNNNNTNAVKKRWLRQATSESASPTVTPPETSPNADMLKAPLKKRKVVPEPEPPCVPVLPLKSEEFASVDRLREIHEKIELEFGVVKSEACAAPATIVHESIFKIDNNVYKIIESVPHTGEAEGGGVQLPLPLLPPSDAEKSKRKPATPKKSPTKATVTKPPKQRKKIKAPKVTKRAKKSPKKSPKKSLRTIDPDFIKNFSDIEDVPLKIRQSLAGAIKIEELLAKKTPEETQTVKDEPLWVDKLNSKDTPIVENKLPWMDTLLVKVEHPVLVKNTTVDTPVAKKLHSVEESLEDEKKPLWLNSSPIKAEFPLKSEVPVKNTLLVENMPTNKETDLRTNTSPVKNEVLVKNSPLAEDTPHANNVNSADTPTNKDTLLWAGQPLTENKHSVKVKNTLLAEGTPPVKNTLIVENKIKIEDTPPIDNMDLGVDTPPIEDKHRIMDRLPVKNTSLADDAPSAENTQCAADTPTKKNSLNCEGKSPAENTTPVRDTPQETSPDKDSLLAKDTDKEMLLWKEKLPAENTSPAKETPLAKETLLSTDMLPVKNTHPAEDTPPVKNTLIVENKIKIEETPPQINQQVASILEKVISRTLKSDQETPSDETEDEEETQQMLETLEAFHRDTLERLVQANKRFCREESFGRRESRGHDHHRRPLRASVSFDSHQHHNHHSHQFNRSVSERWSGGGYGSFHYEKIHHREPITTTYSMYRAQKDRWGKNCGGSQHPAVAWSAAPPPPLAPIQPQLPPAEVVSPQAEALKNATSEVVFGGFLKDKLSAGAAMLPKTKTASSDPRLNPSLVQDAKDEPATPRKKLSLDQYRKRQSLTSITPLLTPEDASMVSSSSKSPSPTLPPAFDPSIAAAAATG